MGAVRFETHPSEYKHWKFSIDEPIARLEIDVSDDEGLRPGYSLKLNSYDLGVDIELADAIQRIRFEHPEVRLLIITSAKDKVFSAGANIYMLGSSSHAFKVNFCKFTNETRLYLEEMSAETGVPSIAALNGTASGGGYELALACDYIVLQDDGHSAVSLPEVPLLAVLPGTGGLTRLVDKRKVRRDLADCFATIAEGVRGKRALDWGLVDEIAPPSKFGAALEAAAAKLAAGAKKPAGPGIELTPLEPKREANQTIYRYVTVRIDPEGRAAEITLRGPSTPQPATAEELRNAGANLWSLRVFRELDDAVLDLRLNHPEIGLLVFKTEGDPQAVLAADGALAETQQTDWFAREVVLQMRRALKRIDLSARSVFAMIESGSCFVGSLFELALASDRIFMLDVEDGPKVGLSPLNFGDLPMSNGLSRLETRFLAEPDRARRLEGCEGLFDTQAALQAGLITFAPDDIDWDDEIRIAIEERAALSADALTAMEANLRFAGPETLETKIFGRLSAWQNWVFQRPNAVGERGGLTCYGRPERPKFDYTRT